MLPRKSSRLHTRRPDDGMVLVVPQRRREMPTCPLGRVPDSSPEYGPGRSRRRAALSRQQVDRARHVALGGIPRATSSMWSVSHGSRADPHHGRHIARGWLVRRRWASSPGTDRQTRSPDRSPPRQRAAATAGGWHPPRVERLGDGDGLPAVSGVATAVATGRRWPGRRPGPARALPVPVAGFSETLVDGAPSAAPPVYAAAPDPSASRTVAVLATPR